MMSPESKAYWLRVILAFITAIICSFFKLTGMRGIIFGILMYIASFYFIRYGLNIGPDELERERLLFTGLGSYIFIWIMMWTFLWTLQQSWG